MDLKQLQDRVAALEADKSTLQASNTQLAEQLKVANDQLAKFSQDTRTASIKQLFSDIGREFKDDDANVKAFSQMSQEAFEASAALMREQAKKTTPSVPAAMFSHTASTGSSAAPGASGAEAPNPLLADAKKRAEQFSQRMV